MATNAARTLRSSIFLINESSRIGVRSAVYFNISRNIGVTSGSHPKLFLTSKFPCASCSPDDVGTRESPANWLRAKLAAGVFSDAKETPLSRFRTFGTSMTILTCASSSRMR